MATLGRQRNRTNGNNLWAVVAAMAVAVLLMAHAIHGQAQTFRVIHTFTGSADGYGPYSGLTMDRAGNFYGTTSGGGTYGFGGVFKLTHSGSGWVLTPLYSFQGGSDGANPEARVIVGPDGALYGTTISGGGAGCGPQGGCGTVFSLRPSLSACKTALCPWTETVLHRFTRESDGAYPYEGDLTFDQAGNLYGAASGGGLGCEFGCGVVFKLAPSMGAWTFSTLYSFTSGSDGAYPLSGVIFDKAGTMYGTTSEDGNKGGGTAYTLTPSGSGWAEATIYAFGDDGFQPQGGLIFDPAGNLYGTTAFGSDGGTVYKLAPSNGGWTATVLASISGYEGPLDSLARDAAGNLYGTSTLTGVNQKGEVFKVAPTNGGWTLNDLYDFTGGSDGYFPTGNLVLDAAWNLYGTTFAGGNLSACGGGCGVVFEITP